MPEEKTETEKIDIEKPEPTICKSFRVTPTEAQRIEQIAQSYGISDSALVRNALKKIGVLERIRP